MLPILNFFANHKLDFVNNDSDYIGYTVLSLLHDFPVPKKILQIERDAFSAKFHGINTSKLSNIKEWGIISPPSLAAINKKYPKRNIVLLGPEGLVLTIAPAYFKLPSCIYERIDWYSPENKEKVQAYRSFFHSLIELFGGDHALYVDERITKKYYGEPSLPPVKTIAAFEKALVSRYGPSSKPMFSYPHGKYPKYYIDNFAGLTHANLKTPP